MISPLLFSQEKEERNSIYKDKKIYTFCSTALSLDLFCGVVGIGVGVEGVVESTAAAAAAVAGSAGAVAGVDAS
jgi:hypothetical protein